MIAPEDFADDAPWPDASGALADIDIPDPIAGVRLQRLVTHHDGRGDLTVLASAQYDADFATPHVYLVTAAAGSVRAWVFHRRQWDRLAYRHGTVRVVLFDIRPDSPTRGRLNVLDLGAANPALLTIPPFVAHGVQNRGAQEVTFVNMPTRAYDPAYPDKSRLKHPHPGVPYVFD
jgi:dTDP-4-dehydrorhamnose 3,5-epimerase